MSATESIDMNTTARYATAMSAFFSQIAGLGNTPKSQQDIEALQRVMASTSIVTSSNNNGTGIDDEYFGTDQNDFDPVPALTFQQLQHYTLHL